MKSDALHFPHELHGALALLQQMSTESTFATALSGLAENLSSSSALPSFPIRTSSAQAGESQADLRYRSLIEKLPVVTFIAGLDENKREMYVSPQIESLLGFTQQEWLADPFLWYRQLHPDDRDEWVTQFAQTCMTGSHFRVEYRLIRRNGGIVWVQGECQVIRDAAGTPLFMQGIAMDITHRKQAAAIEEARLSAEAANRAKSEFLARMSHEIRTPLNGVVGMIDLLRSTVLSDSQHRYTQLARDSADALLSVINDVLDFSKIEAGKVEVDAVEFDFHQQVEDLIELLAPVAAKKNLALASLLRPDVPHRLIGDPTRIRQVLTNLINNAMKFTSRGYVSIRASLDRRDEDGLLIRVQVEDTGIGIPADRIDRLFKSFSQVDVSTTRKYGGTGLGLVISKQLVELMGGQIGIQSEVGRGTTFWFTLKLKVPATGDRSGDEGPAEALRNVRVLAVESDPTYRRILSEQLDGRLAGSSAITNTNEAAEVLRRAAREGNPFAVALIPYDSRAGSKLAAEIQADPALRHMNLIALMDLDDRVDDQATHRAGFFARLHRPIVQSRLLDAIASATVQSTLKKPSVCTAAAVTQQSLKGLHLLVAEDNEMNQFVTQETLRRVGCTCEIVGDGAQALERAFSGKFDAILMDCQMPVMDGLEASRSIRQREIATGAAIAIPIIALTAEAIQGDREKCLNAGMNGYVSKPINADELFAAIGSLVTPGNARRVSAGEAAPAANGVAMPIPTERAAAINTPVKTGREGEGEIAAKLSAAPAGDNRSENPGKSGGVNPPAAPAPSEVPVVPPIDLEALMGRCMRDAQFAMKTLEKFGRRAAEDAKLIRRGAAAGDADGTRLLAHNLNAVAAHVAAAPLGKIAFEIADAAARRDLQYVEQQLERLEQETRRCASYIPAAIEQIARMQQTAPATKATR